MSSNLFGPVPGSEGLSAASQWLIELLGGQFVTTIAVLAIAFLGYEMLTGRISMSHALRVVLGCFILLGSSAIARGLIDAGHGVEKAAPVGLPTSTASPAAVNSPVYREPSGPANGNPFDPYASRGSPD